MQSIAQRAKREFLDYLFPAIFFFLSFELLAFSRAMALREYGIRVSVFLAAAVGALIVAKVVVLLDHVPLINKFPDKPLIYNVVWKTLLYALAALVVRYFEHLLHFWRKSDSLAQANRSVFQEVDLPHFLLVQTWLVVMLLVFVGFRELSHALGPDKVRRMFFAKPERAGGDADR